MRKVEVGSSRFTEVFALDEPGSGGACHEYAVMAVRSPNGTMGGQFAMVSFQSGPVSDGINGCHNEDLLAIVADRLQGFQSGEFLCKENEKALAHIHDALFALQSRTQRRQAAGVEGTLQKTEGDGVVNVESPKPHNLDDLLTDAREACRMLVHATSHDNGRPDGTVNNDPARWLGIARTHLQLGLMAAERAIKGGSGF